ncbi:MAG: hypothetical protein HY763_07625 [Planctomycetes bacterium]|nr:hypothetical protein [Planctomycetota bacterium]
METRDLDRLVGHHPANETYPFCLNCGYDLRGAPRGRCSECGAPFSFEEWRQEVDRISTVLSSVDDALRLVPLGWVVAMAGAVARVLGIIFPLYEVGTWAGRLAALLCGIAATFLGAGALRVRELPAWARPRLASKPPVLEGVVGALLGIGLVATSIVSPW